MHLGSLATLVSPLDRLRERRPRGGRTQFLEEGLHQIETDRRRCAVPVRPLNRDRMAAGIVPRLVRHLIGGPLLMRPPAHFARRHRHRPGSARLLQHVSQFVVHHVQPAPTARTEIRTHENVIADRQTVGTALCSGGPGIRPLVQANVREIMAEMMLRFGPVARRQRRSAAAGKHTRAMSGR